MEFHSASSPTLIIGNLAEDIDKNKLRRHFARFGIIVELTIKKELEANQQHQNNGTYALCHYAETASAVRAYQQMDKKLLGTKRIMLGFHKLTPTEFVWVAGLNEEVSATDLFLQCSQFGSAERVTIDKFRELALVKFVQVDSAQNAVHELRGTTLQGRRLQADFATDAWQTDFFELLDEQNADVETSAELDNEDTTELDEAIAILTASNDSQSPVPETSSTNVDHNYTNAAKSCLESDGSEEMLEYELLSIHDEEENENPAESLNDMVEENDKTNQEQEQNIEMEIVPQTSSPTVTTTNNDTAHKTNTNTKPTRKRRGRKRNNPSIIDRNASKHKCEFCPAAFNGRAQLSNHINYLHMGEPKQDMGTSPNTQTFSTTPVQHFCEWCPYWTYQKGSLNLHNQRVHLDLLPEQPKLPVREPFRRTVAIINEMSSSKKSKLEPCSCTMQSTSHFSDELIIYSPTSSPAISENSLIMTMSQPESPLSGTPSSACFVLVSCDEDLHQQDNDAEVDAEYVGDVGEN